MNPSEHEQIRALYRAAQCGSAALQHRLLLIEFDALAMSGQSDASGMAGINFAEHVDAARQLAAAVDRRSARTQAYEHLLTRYPSPLWLLSTKGDICFANHAAVNISHLLDGMRSPQALTIRARLKALEEEAESHSRYDVFHCHGDRKQLAVLVPVSQNNDCLLPLITHSDHEGGLYWLCMLTLNQDSHQMKQLATHLNLTVTERELARFLLAGDDIHAMALSRSVSEATIRSQLKHLKKKLQCNSIEALIAKLFSASLLSFLDLRPVSSPAQTPAADLTPSLEGVSLPP